jgi:glycosyltransferase involved in cell wall biosynthesis
LFSELKGAKAFVFPSHREGFGIAALEALACGLPVITTSAPDNMAQHLVSRSIKGIVCEPTVECLTDAIRTVLANGHAENGHAENGHERWLEEYDWDAIAARVAGVVLA